MKAELLPILDFALEEKGYDLTTYRAFQRREQKKIIMTGRSLQFSHYSDWLHESHDIPLMRRKRKRKLMYMPVTRLW
jgi:hypothetical protein